MCSIGRCSCGRYRRHISPSHALLSYLFAALVYFELHDPMPYRWLPWTLRVSLRCCGICAGRHRGEELVGARFDSVDNS